jgi:hypothetical protein
MRYSPRGPVACRSPLGLEPNVDHTDIIRIAPSERENRAALERVAASAAFAHAPMLVAFLRFVVGAVLTGRGDQLKGYTIAVEALGRTADFDPGTDAIVRVDAGRIRRALTRYYQTEGAHDAVVIELPLGHYAPTFSRGTWRAPSPSRWPDAGGPFGSDRPGSGPAAERHVVLRKNLALNRAAIAAEIISIRAKLVHSHKLLASLDSAAADERVLIH